MLDIPAISSQRRSPAAARPAPVLLVGAGAGDAGHLTLAALDALRRADVVFADDLVDASILALIPPHVDVRRVGKRARRPSAAQADINAALIAAARAGLRVVRLKGGDPFVFGRGGEEADALRDAGLEVAVVPGLTAALVAAAATGIPLTDRRRALQLAFVTATAQDGTTPDLSGLVGPGRTLVVYMGGGKGREIVARLVTPDISALPAAVVENAGRSGQRWRATTVAGLAAALDRRDTAAPTLIIIGEVVGLARSAVMPHEVHADHG
jgi:uroporphyrin-III C-methyltransferase